MNKRLVTVLGSSLAVASLVTFLLYVLVVNKISSSSSAPQGEIVVAARDLQRGELLKDADLKVVGWASPNLPKGAFTDRKSAIGWGVVSEIAAGEPVIEARLAPAGAGAGLAPSIPIGKRAVSLRVNEVVAVAGYVLPGSRVDVLVTGNAPGQAQQGPEIRTLLQNVEVLSAGTNIQRDAEGKPVQVPVVTLLVSPEDAETLSLASNETRVQLVLRNPMDADKVEPKGTAVARLFRDGKSLPPAQAEAPRKKVAVKLTPPPPPPAPPPAPQPIVVELLKGPARTNEKFPGEKAPGEKLQ